MPDTQLIHDLTDPRLLASCREALQEVLETMFFELPVEDLTLGDGPSDDDLLAFARFSGSLSGTLAVAASPNVCAPLAAGFLGIEPDEISPADRDHMIIEIGNMLTGATMSRIEPAGRLRIDQPTLPDSETRASLLALSPWLRFPMDNGHLLVFARYGES